MKHYLLVIAFLSLNTYSQDSLNAKLITSKEFSTKSYIGTDNFNATYYQKNNTLYKVNNGSELNFSNIQLGEITEAHIFNPLKIVLFYKPFNTVIILDNRLTEISKIDFNTISPFKNISHVSPGFDNAFWVFNTDNQQLELYNYKNSITRLKTLPVQSNVLDLASNYNYCWMLTENYLYKYNYMGSLLQKIENDGYSSIEQFNDNLLLQKENTLYVLLNNSEKLVKLNLPELLINRFSVTNETLYIYDSKKLTEFQLTIN